MNSPDFQKDYRADIDGLRAVAVLAVVFYHLGIPGFSGGFVGVDIFFVISGYLITGIICHQWSAKKFSLHRFYERRARRILPALFLVTITTYLIGLFVLLPEDLIALGKSVIAVALFGANFYFWKTSGYFQLDSHDLQLLHTWSLGVEEQFYLLWPLLLLFLLSLSRRKLVVLLIFGMAISSLMLGEWLLRQGRFSAGFYLLPVRAWELMSGALLVLIPLPKTLPGKLNTLLGLFGLGMILTSVFIFDSTTRFPGLNALLPCLGTVFIIQAGKMETGPISKLLGTRLLVGIGLISYSLYLWHWPIVSFFHYTNFRMPVLEEAFVLLVICLVVSYFSWRFVEVPFRRQSNLSPSRTVNVAILSVSGSMVILLIGLMTVQFDGYPTRLSQSALKFASDESTLTPLARECLSELSASKPKIGCRIGSENPQAEYQVAIWGDSHAAHFVPLIETLALQYGWVGRQMSLAGCAGLVNAEPRLDRYKNCPPFNEAVMQELAESEDVELVILAARWHAYSRKIEHLNETLQGLVTAKKRVLILGQVPETDFPSKRCLALRAWKAGELDDCKIALDSETMRKIALNEKAMQEIADKFSGVTYVSLKDLVCVDDNCPVEMEGYSVYFDNNHITPFGSKLIATKLMEAERLNSLFQLKNERSRL